MARAAQGRRGDQKGNAVTPGPRMEEAPASLALWPGTGQHPGLLCPVRLLVSVSVLPVVLPSFRLLPSTATRAHHPRPGSRVFGSHHPQRQLQGQISRKGICVASWSGGPGAGPALGRAVHSRRMEAMEHGLGQEGPQGAGSSWR